MFDVEDANTRVQAVEKSGHVALSTQKLVNVQSCIPGLQSLFHSLKIGTRLRDASTWNGCTQTARSPATAICRILGPGLFTVRPRKGQVRPN